MATLQRSVDFYYEPSDSSGADNKLSGCVGGGEGYEKVDSYETNTVYLAIDVSSIPSGSTITNVAVSFYYRQAVYNNQVGLAYNSDLDWMPVILSGSATSGSKFTNVGTVTGIGISSVERLINDIDCAKTGKGNYNYRSSPTTASKSCSFNISNYSSPKIGVRFDIDSNNIGDVWFYFKEVKITVTYTEPHTHNYTSSITTQPTCTTTGVRTYTCSCGSSYTETISAKGHTETTVPSVSATCMATGLTEGKKCSVCGTIITAQQIIAKLEHIYTSQVILPTVTADGYTLHTCKYGCGTNYKDNYTTNKICLGTSQPKEIYIGTSKVKAVYVGTTKVYG